jgi:hypothetical protein
MRRCIMSVALLAAYVAAGCTDNTPTSTGLRPDALTPSANLAPTQSLSDFIDEQIAEVFKQGHATSVASRWATVKRKKTDGDVDGARKHFIQLADWITKKTEAKTLPDETAQLVTARIGATRLVYAMSLWVFVGEDAAVPVIGGDSKAEVVPAGEPATVVTESKRAGVDLDEGSTAEDRLIVVVEDPSRYPGHCNGPLNTVLCQYPQFYKFESFPKKKLLKRGRFAVCMVTAGDRRPLDYSDDDPRANDPDHPHAKEEVHERLRLAHDKPANPDDFTEGSKIVDGIEILPMALNQSGFTDCDRPIEYGGAALPLVRGGWLGRSQRVLMAIASFTGRLLTPKNAYAYDRGPEHESFFFSHFNAVDPESRPDLRPVGITAPAEVWRGDAMSIGATITNKSRRQLDGNATAASVATSVSIYLVRDVPGEGEDDVVTEEVRLCNSDEEACAFAVSALRPDVTDPAIGGALFSLLVPDGVDPGHWFVEVRVAASGRLEEADPDNNVARSANPILIKKKLPDLRFQAGFTITSPTTVRVGGTITTSTWTVENIGNAPSGPYIARFFLSSESGDVALGDPIAHESLAPGAVAVHDGVTLTIAGGTQPGTYDVLLRLDPANAVEEFRDDNNVAISSTPITVEDDGIRFGFEDVEPEWLMTGFWNRSALAGIVNSNFGPLPSPFSGSRSLWYGRSATGNFLSPFGGPNSGNARSQTFTMPTASSGAQVRLEFKTWWEIEAVSPGSFDIMSVELEVTTATGTQTRVLKRLNPAPSSGAGGGSAAQAYASGCTPATCNFSVGFRAPIWVSESIVVPSDVHGKTVRIRLSFNTGDGLYNNMRGWIVDDVVVRVTSIGPSSSLAPLFSTSPGEELVPADQIVFPVRPQEQ